MAVDLTPQQVREADAVLIDVREDDEWAAGRIEGSVHIPLGVLSERAAEVPGDRTVVFVCRSGARSAMAADAFAASGYDVRNLGGGLKGWTAAGLPLDGHLI